MRDRLQKVLPVHCVKFATTWSATCAVPAFVTLFETLRYATDQSTRTALVEQLRKTAIAHGKPGGW